jgi:hypothetical protein
MSGAGGLSADATCQGCACEAEHDGDYGSSGHAGPCPRHTCDLTDGAA